MQFFKGYRDVKGLICAKLEFRDLLALKAVDRDCRDYINKYHLDKFYRYMLGNFIQIGEMKMSCFTYKFPTEAEIMRSFPKAGIVDVYYKRGDVIESGKAVPKIVFDDCIMTRAIFLVRINLPREPDARKLVYYTPLDPVNRTKDRYLMIVNEVDAKYLVPCRVMIIDRKLRIIKHIYFNNSGEVQRLNYMELALPPDAAISEDPEFTKSKSIIS